MPRDDTSQGPKAQALGKPPSAKYESNHTLYVDTVSPSRATAPDASTSTQRSAAGSKALTGMRRRRLTSAAPSVVPSHRARTDCRAPHSERFDGCVHTRGRPSC